MFFNGFLLRNCKVKVFRLICADLHGLHYSIDTPPAAAALWHAWAAGGTCEVGCTVADYPNALANLAIMGNALRIVYRTLATHLIKKTGRTHHTAHTGAVTLNAK